MGKIRSVRLGSDLEERLERGAKFMEKVPSEAIREAVEQWCRQIEAQMPLSVLLEDIVGSVHGNGLYSARDHEEVIPMLLMQDRMNQQK